METLNKNCVNVKFKITIPCVPHIQESQPNEYIEDINLNMSESIVLGGACASIAMSK